MHCFAAAFAVASAVEVLEGQGRDDEQTRQEPSGDIHGRVHPARDARQRHEQRPEHRDGPRAGDGN